MTTIVRCARALIGGAEVRDTGMLIDGDRFARVAPFAELHAAHRDAQVREHRSDVIIVPGFINGHSHAYQILLRGWGDDLTFAQWRSDALYKIVPSLTPEQVYDTFVVAFDEMLSAGITTVAEFFYLNGAGNAHAEQAIRAARDTGIRLVFARTWMDAEYAPPAFRETIDQAAERTRELLERYPEANVCVAPHSLHAASHEMIRAAHEFAKQHDCAMHIHVAEAQYEGAETLARHGATPIALLERLGVLDQRTVAIHAIYITEDEKDFLAARRARVVHNPMTNQYLGDGICDVVGLAERGVVLGLGTDADVKPSLIDEMRAASLLQKIRTLDGSALGARAAFDLGTRSGAAALGIDAGALEAGRYADYLVVDAAAIDAWSPAVNALVYRGENSWVREVYVGGRRVRAAVRSDVAERATRALEAMIPALQLR